MPTQHASLLVSFVATSWAVAGGCGTFGTSTSYLVDQAALNPAPGAMHASGALAPGHSVVLEGSGDVVDVVPSDRPHGAAQPGHVVPTASGRLRLAIGINDRLEVGADIEAGFGSFATSIASDVPSPLFAGQAFVRGGVQVRGIIAGSRRLGLVLGGEASLASIPYQRIVRSTDDGDFDTPQIPFGPSLGFSSALVPYVRAGASITAQPIRSLSLAAGVMLQTQPEFFGEASFTYSCTYGFLSSSCTGMTPNQTSPYAIDGVGTAFTSVTWSLGVAEFVAQFFVHFAGPASVVESTPFGGQFAVRFNFDWRPRAPREHEIVPRERPEVAPYPIMAPRVIYVVMPP